MQLVTRKNVPRHRANDHAQLAIRLSCLAGRCSYRTPPEAGAAKIAYDAIVQESGCLELPTVIFSNGTAMLPTDLDWPGGLQDRVDCGIQPIGVFGTLSWTGNTIALAYRTLSDRPFDRAVMRRYAEEMADAFRECESGPVTVVAHVHLLALAAQKSALRTVSPQEVQL